MYKQYKNVKKKNSAIYMYYNIKMKTNKNPIIHITTSFDYLYDQL